MIYRVCVEQKSDIVNGDEGDDDAAVAVDAVATTAENAVDAVASRNAKRDMEHGAGEVRHTHPSNILSIIPHSHIDSRSNSPVEHGGL